MGTSCGGTALLLRKKQGSVFFATDLGWQHVADELRVYSALHWIITLTTSRAIDVVRAHFAITSQC